eukprot:scaffold3.g6690.t1
MGKRKAQEAGLPPTLVAEPVEAQGVGPFAVYFPSGVEPNASSAALRWEAAKSAQQKNHFVLSAKTPDDVVNYYGSTGNAEYTSALPCRYALALVNKRTGRMEVMPAEGGRVFRMEPKVTALSYAPRGDAAGVDDDARRAANTRLVEQFGSQRRQRQLRAREAGAVKSEHVSAGAAVLGLIAEAGAGAMQTKEEIIQASLAQRNIPPHHPEATTAEEAYREDEIVPASVRDALEITKLFPAENKPEYREQLDKSGQFGAGYVLSRLPVLQAKDKATREARARMLALLGHLLKLHAKFGSMRSRGGLEDLAQQTKMHPSVLEGLTELFYTREQQGDGAKFVLSSSQKDLMVAYIMVLAVRAEPECVLEAETLERLAAEVKMKPGDMAARYKELGCVDMSVSALAPDGTKKRSHKIVLMPHSAEGKALADYFPSLKLGGKKRR